jgi:KaiC/GvpD/RAD55 family RecA-like ATPase
MIPQSFWIDEYVETADDWVIDGLICPYINTLSGQPKVGKSTFATQVALAVINQTPFLGREIHAKSTKVAWMGFDSGWVRELKSRCGDNAKNSILMQKGMTNLNPSHWGELGQYLSEKDIGLLVIDHLYGFAGDLNLNESQEANKVINCLNAINSQWGIPILLIAQATKNNHSGGMAHSNILKSSARVLLEMSGTARGGKRRITINGNEVAGESISIKIDPTHIELLESAESKESKQERDYARNLRNTQRFFEDARDGELAKVATATSILIRLKISSSYSGASKMLYRWQNAKLIEVTDTGIIRGENCFT